MTLQDAKAIPTPIKTPSNFQNKITILTNCSLTEDEVSIFNLALKVVSEYTIKNNLDLSGCDKFNVVFTNNGSFSFLEKDAKVYGSQLQLAIYNMDKLRHANHYTVMLFVFIEELSHYFLRIYDETLIKHKVSEMIRYVIPDFDLNDMKGVLYGI